MNQRNAYIKQIFSNSKYCRFDDQSCLSDSTSQQEESDINK